jgi:hypothetical protein
VLAAALILHLGIDATINLPVFEWAFIAGLITFVDAEDLDKVAPFLKSKAYALACLIGLIPGTTPGSEDSTALQTRKPV